MSKFVLDTSAMSYISENILTLESEMTQISSEISSYDVSEASEFNFSSAVKCIAANVESASEKIKNTTTLIKNVIDTHSNLQNSLKFTGAQVQTSSNNSSSKPSAVSRGTSSAGALSGASAGVVTENRTSSGTSKTSGTSGGYSNEAKETPIPTPNTSSTNVNLGTGNVINIPAGLGSVHTYMGWQLITSKSSPQYKLREQAGMNFDNEGFGKIDGRYVIACTTTFGEVGDYVDFTQEDGTVIKCIIGDIKNQNDRGCTKWGHDNGQTIVEFVVDKGSWYNTGHSNPGTNNCHPEWKQNIVSATNYGSYFDK